MLQSLSPQELRLVLSTNQMSENYIFPQPILLLPTWMKFDLHFSSAPTFLWRHRGKRRRRREIDIQTDWVLFFLGWGKSHRNFSSQSRGNVTKASSSTVAKAYMLRQRQNSCPIRQAQDGEELSSLSSAETVICRLWNKSEIVTLPYNPNRFTPRTASTNAYPPWKACWSRHHSLVLHRLFPPAQNWALPLVLISPLAASLRSKSRRVIGQDADDATGGLRRY